MIEQNKYIQPHWAVGQETRMSGLIEDTCEHGVGHPNMEWLRDYTGENKESMGIHGCDGCCSNNHIVDGNNKVGSETNQLGDNLKNGNSNSGDSLKIQGNNDNEIPESQPHKVNNGEVMTYTDGDGHTSSVEFGWDGDIYDLMERVERLLMAVGFHPDTVKEGFRYMANEYYETSE